jgi:hypothetical protein
LTLFFPSAGVFNLGDSVWSVVTKQPLITLIIKAKSNCVAYFEAKKIQEKKPGRPPKYGEKVILAELFDQLYLFSKISCMIYGKLENVSILSVDLLWKPTGKLIRFLLAITSHGPIVLMCSDLNQDPKLAIELYCMRTRVETMFDMLKNLIGAFHYRFWSKVMPSHPRKPKRNKDLKQPSSAALPKVKLCWEAYERFVMIGAISLGLLQILAIKFNDTVWKHFDAYLRTQSRNLPSERTVKYVISCLLIRDLCTSAPSAIIRKIKLLFFWEKSPPKCDGYSAESEKQAA